MFSSFCPSMSMTLKYRLSHRARFVLEVVRIAVLLLLEPFLIANSDIFMIFVFFSGSYGIITRPGLGKCRRERKENVQSIVPKWTFCLYSVGVPFFFFFWPSKKMFYDMMMFIVDSKLLCILFLFLWCFVYPQILFPWQHCR